MTDGEQHSFLFHDYETFGTSPSLDRPSQFAAIRTDEDLNIVGEPEVFYCRIADDYLPQPQAVMVTGVTPQEAKTKPFSPAAFTICSRCQKPVSSAITTCASMTK